MPYYARRFRPSFSRIRPKTVYRIAKKAAHNVLDAEAEKKIWNTNNALSPASPSIGGTLTDLSAVTLGDGATNRDGLQIEPYSFKVRMDAVVADTYNRIRVIFFQWLEDDTSNPPTMADILRFEAADAHQYNSQLQIQNFSTGSRYKILKDFVITLDVDKPTANYILKFKKHKLKDIYFTDGQTTGWNHLYLLLISDSTITAHPLVTVQTRLRFTDV